MPVDLVRGTHIEIAASLARRIYYLEAPSDGRAVFTIPWKGRTMIGTTEVPQPEGPDHTAASAAEIDYLVETLRHYFPDVATDVVDAWAGLRVLPARSGRAFNRSRETTLLADNPRAPRIISVYGGKLTGYRHTAEQVMRLAHRALPERKRVARTDQLPLV